MFVGNTPDLTRAPAGTSIRFEVTGSPSTVEAISTSTYWAPASVETISKKVRPSLTASACFAVVFGEVVDRCPQGHAVEAGDVREPVVVRRRHGRVEGDRPGRGRQRRGGVDLHAAAYRRPTELAGS